MPEFIGQALANGALTRACRTLTLRTSGKLPIFVHLVALSEWCVNRPIADPAGMIHLGHGSMSIGFALFSIVYFVINASFPR
jgi:hypothetical protein